MPRDYSILCINPYTVFIYDKFNRISIQGIFHSEFSYRIDHTCEKFLLILENTFCSSDLDDTFFRDSALSNADNSGRQSMILSYNN